MNSVRQEERLGRVLDWPCPSFRGDGVVEALKQTTSGDHAPARCRGMFEKLTQMLLT
jgi:hypothetical protein